VITYSAASGVATITIDDPERRNPLSNEAMRHLRMAIDRSSQDADVSVVVLTGAGDKAFSAGGDLSGGFVDSPLSSHEARSSLAELFRAMSLNPKPIIGRINGLALGGGFGVAVACDITIAADDVHLGTPEIDLGLWPMMISAVLVRAMPRKPLMEMMMTGRIIDSATALELGLVTSVVPRDSLDAAVDETIATLLTKSPAALALGKRAFYAMSDMDIDTALDTMHLGLTASASTEDAVEGVGAFIDKRDPEWKGR
jgi:enoyl-CoA hydratase